MSWPLVKFSDVCSVLSGFAFKSQQFGDLGLPIVRIRDVVRGYSDTHYCGEYEDKYLLENGDMLVGMDGDFNLAKWKGGKALLNQRVCKIIPNSTLLDKDYIFYFLPIALMEIWKATPFVTVKHLSVKSINEIKIPLPPLPIQKQIAAVLEKADTLRQQCQQMEQELNALAQAVFLEMFGDPATNPKRWPVGTIGECCASVNYGTSEKSNEDKGQYAVLRMNNITYDGRWNFDSLKYMDLQKKDEEKYLVESGDILFNRTNSKELVGKTAVYRENHPMAFAGYLVRARVNHLAVPEYISGVMNSRYGKQTLLNMCKSIVGMANINAKEFQKIRLPLPPASLQEEYQRIVFSINTRLTELKDNKDHFDGLFEVLMQRAFKGELDLTNGA